MSTVTTEKSTHLQEKELSYTNLQKSRELAAKKSNYCSETTRRALVDACLEHCNNRTPYPWQLDAAEAFLLGLDCTILAGTGSGKSLPFVMPAMVKRNGVLIVISPLNALEEDQVARCQKMGLTAVAVNHKTDCELLRKELQLRKYQVIYTSPEMALGNPSFNNLLCSPDYHAHLLGLVIDEAHCITQWGKDFRPTYSKLDKLRSFIPDHIPIYATSATMTPEILREVRTMLHISSAESFHLNLGNDRPNIYPEIRTIAKSTDYAAFDFVFEGATQVDDIPRSLIFVNRVIDSQHGWQRVYRNLPPSLRDCIGFLNARRSERAKTHELELFMRGKRRSLWVTEIGGMGLDIPDISFVGQLGVPQSLTTWLQRAGRAGRSANIDAHAVLGVEASVFQVAGGGTSPVESVDPENESEDEGDNGENKIEKTYRKKIDPTLREYVETRECRRDVADRLFDNPPRLTTLARCCDNCSKKLENSLISDSDSAVTHTMETDDFQPSDTDQATDPPTQMTTAHSQRVQRRTLQHLQSVREALQAWRTRTRRRDFPHAPFTAIVILPDAVLTSIASNRQLNTLAELERSLPTRWAFVERYGQEVLDLVATLDEEDRARREDKRLADREAKRQENERRDAVQASQRLVNATKENSSIPGTGCFELSKNTSANTTPARPATSAHPKSPLSPRRSNITRTMEHVLDDSLPLHFPGTPSESPIRFAVPPVHSSPPATTADLIFDIYTPQRPFATQGKRSQTILMESGRASQKRTRRI